MTLAHNTAAHATLAGLRATIDLAPIGLAQFDRTGRFLHVNNRLCEILGCVREQLESRTFQEITFPDDLQYCIDLTTKVVAGLIPGYCVEKRFVRPDGSIVWTRITVSAAPADGGGVGFLIGAAEDISAQVDATDALRHTEERLRAALDASMIGTFRWDVRRNALDWADGLERVFGPGTRATLADFFSAIHPDDRDATLAAYNASATAGADFEADFRVIWADGSLHWLHDRGRTILGDDGRPRYIVGAITDVTKDVTERLAHQQQMQEAMQREQDARRAAERAIHARQQVLAFVAHDLRNPLQAILTGAALLGVPSTPEQASQRAAMIKRCAGDMERLITDLLDVSRIDAGTFAVRHEPLDLDRLLRDVADRWREAARNTGAAFEAIVQPLPPITGDRQRLTQAIGNLLNNAVKFTPAGGRIRLTAGGDDQDIVITVADTGCGIPAAEVALIFNRFWQRDRALGGAGLGLPIVKGIVESHGGEIAVESAVGTGTTFRIRLPRDRGSHPPQSEVAL